MSIIDIWSLPEPVLVGQVREVDDAHSCEGCHVAGIIGEPARITVPFGLAVEGTVPLATDDEVHLCDECGLRFVRTYMTPAPDEGSVARVVEVFARLAPQLAERGLTPSEVMALGAMLAADAAVQCGMTRDSYLAFVAAAAVDWQVRS